MSGMFGKVIVRSDLEAITGLRVGGSTGGLKIGGVDLNVITDPWGRPYIPGSSIKGKTRSLLERFHSAPVTQNGIHMCKNDQDYTTCPICRIWGLLGDAKKFTQPTLTRLLVGDVFLDESSVTEEMQKNMELRWTEVKMETAINRITGTAHTGSLRQIERVPAGARFSNANFIFNVFEESDKDLLKQLFIALELLENDYLGGMGSRGSGRVRFVDMEVYWNDRSAYETGRAEQEPARKINGEWNTPSKLVQHFDQIKDALK
ncbi:MAG: type III-A CRISPR-associated RAMP protein Csm3 [Deltaproteobacteria bacterium]|nr:type III-A CRISPR-associated RAMP protein Csm3 [Deltaproteobacteria bacterium]